jgi:hypothetical protein
MNTMNMNIFFDKCLRIDRKINKEEKKNKKKKSST